MSAPAPNPLPEDVARQCAAVYDRKGGELIGLVAPQSLVGMLPTSDIGDGLFGLPIYSSVDEARIAFAHRIATDSRCLLRLIEMELPQPDSFKGMAARLGYLP